MLEDLGSAQRPSDHALQRSPRAPMTIGFWLAIHPYRCVNRKLMPSTARAQLHGDAVGTS